MGFHARYRMQTERHIQLMLKQRGPLTYAELSASYARMLDWFDPALRALIKRGRVLRLDGKDLKNLHSGSFELAPMKDSSPSLAHTSSAGTTQEDSP